MPNRIAVQVDLNATGNWKSILAQGAAQLQKIQQFQQLQTRAPRGWTFSHPHFGPGGGMTGTLTGPRGWSFPSAHVSGMGGSLTGPAAGAGWAMFTRGLNAATVALGGIAAASAGLIAAASPDAWSTLAGSVRLVAAELGQHLMPAVRGISIALQGFARWLREHPQVGQAISQTAQFAGDIVTNPQQVQDWLLNRPPRPPAAVAGESPFYRREVLRPFAQQAEAFLAQHPGLGQPGTLGNVQLLHPQFLARFHQMRAVAAEWQQLQQHPEIQAEERRRRELQRYLTGPELERQLARERLRGEFADPLDRVRRWFGRLGGVAPQAQGVTPQNQLQVFGSFRSQLLGLTEFRDLIARQAVQLPGELELQRIQAQSLARLVGIDANLQAILAALTSPAQPPMAGVGLGQ
jgi:hypothetical protein